MKLSPGDTVQIILTVGGVPYAKTWAAKGGWSRQASETMCHALYKDLCDDIDNFSDESALGD